jgi:hypothetical protein
LLGPLSLLSSFLVRFPMIWMIFLIVSLSVACVYRLFGADRVRFGCMYRQ